MWYSQSEANYREVFRAAREAAATNPGSKVVMFFDEVDSIGKARQGGAYSRVHDNVLTAFLAELDGLAERGDILVVAATNRPEDLDPALARAGRLGDLRITVPRPNRRAAQAILAKHLPAELHYTVNGSGADSDAARHEIIENATSKMFAANGETELANLTFRDGQRRTIRMPDLINGAVIASIARSAVERACLRKIQTGERGVRWEDVSLEITTHFQREVASLTPSNCRSYLTGLPYDLDVVNVEPIVRRVKRPPVFWRPA
jgi:SpoVK/Ycf46/Vps4 family AAA+-type ATPase